MNIVISITDSLAPFKPFIRDETLTYLQQYPFFYSESLLSFFDKKTMKFCLMMPTLKHRHPMEQTLFTYESISYILFNHPRFQIFQKVKVRRFIATILKKYQGTEVSLTMLSPIHLATFLNLSSFIKNKLNIKLIHIHHQHKHNAQHLRQTNRSILTIADHATEADNTLPLKLIKTKITTLSMIKHRYIFASFVHLHAQSIQFFVNNFMTLNIPNLHLYIELLDEKFSPYPYDSLDARIHFLTSMTNKERTSYINHAYFNILAIENHQTDHQAVYSDMLLQLLATGIPLLSTPNEEFLETLDPDTYWLKNFTHTLIKKALLTMLQQDYSAMIRVALFNQNYILKTFNGVQVKTQFNQFIKK
jgi:hypothetical protein